MPSSHKSFYTNIVVEILLLMKQLIFNFFFKFQNLNFLIFKQFREAPELTSLKQQKKC